MVNQDIDLIVHTSSLLPPLTGIGRYTEQLIKCFMDDSIINDIRAFDQLKTYSRKELAEKIHQREPQRESGVKYALLRKYLRMTPGGYWVRQQVKKQLSKSILKNSQRYIYWEPNYIIQPFSGSSVATIHDLSHLRHPEYHSSAMLKWLDKELPYTLNNATALVTVSEFSRNEMSQLLGIEKNNITVVPPGVAPEFRVRHSMDEIMRVKQAYQLPDKFILTVGTLEPRKNTLGLMQAYCLLPSGVRKQFPLVVVGAPGWHQRIDEKKIQALVRKGEIRLMGFVAQCDLPLLYQAATLFSYVSFYEGYGIPIAEAMACNVPVVTSDRASMPEVANGCAKLVNPDDPDDIAQALQSFLEDEKYRKTQGEQGNKKSLTYTWERSAEKLLELFLRIRNYQ